MFGKNTKVDLELNREVEQLLKTGGKERILPIVQAGEPVLRQQTVPPEDAKSKLQEWAQAKSLPLPVYKLLGKSGTDHSPQFEIEVAVEGLGRASAVASSISGVI